MKGVPSAWTRWTVTDSESTQLIETPGTDDGTVPDPENVKVTRFPLSRSARGTIPPADCGSPNSLTPHSVLTASPTYGSIPSPDLAGAVPVGSNSTVSRRLLGKEVCAKLYCPVPHLYAVSGPVT